MKILPASHNLYESDEVKYMRECSPLPDPFWLNMRQGKVSVVPTKHVFLLKGLRETLVAHVCMCYSMHTPLRLPLCSFFLPCCSQMVCGHNCNHSKRSRWIFNSQSECRKTVALTIKISRPPISLVPRPPYNVS